MQKKYYLYQMSGVVLNVVSVIIFLVMAWITGCIYKDSTFTITDNTFILVIALMIPYLMLHEVIHGISYVLCGAESKNITYGMHMEKGIFCCLCKQNITKKNILISIMCPFIFIGVITYVIGVMVDSSVLILLSIFNISGCAGDLVMFFDLLGVKNIEYSEYDNPMAFGLYSSEDLSKCKLFGLKYVGEQEELEKKDLKKVKISLFSVVVIGLIAGSIICMLFLKKITDSRNEALVVGKTYTYTGDSVSAMGNDCFTITIDEDGTFTYYESVFSSYIGFGKWSIENGVITLTEDGHMENPRVNHFRIDDNDIIFIEEDSSNFIYIKVEDRDRFTSDLETGEQQSMDERIDDTETLSAGEKQTD